MQGIGLRSVLVVRKQADNAADSVPRERLPLNYSPPLCEKAKTDEDEVLVNAYGKTYVIGDIHGCHGALVKILQRIKPNPREDVIIFLGDYIDRGPDSKQVVSEILRLRRKFPRLITLKGNHEQMFLDYLTGRDRDLFLMTGGRQTLTSYGIRSPFAGVSAPDIPAEHFHFFKELLLSWEDANYVYVHAGLQPGVHLTQQSDRWLLWARDAFLESNFDFGKKVIFGHTPFRAPMIEHNKIGIDTGAVYGGRLTCLVLPDLKFISV